MFFYYRKTLRSLMILPLLGLLILLVACGSSVGATSLPTPTLRPTPTPMPSPTPILSPTPTGQETPGTSTYMVDATSGTILINTFSHLHLQMASITKVMTAVLAIEHLNPTDIETIQPDELSEVPPGGYSIAFLQPNDQLSVLDLLYGLLLPSGSDAAIALAHIVSGDTASFVALMNQKAGTLGLNDTHFTSPAGFTNSANYSTTADLTKLANYAMSLPMFAQIVRQQNFVLPATQYRHAYNWQNTNQLLGAYPGADGVKTGTSDEAGYCLVFSATRRGHRLIGTILHDTQNRLYPDAMSALDTGFAKIA